MNMDVEGAWFFDMIGSGYYEGKLVLNKMKQLEEKSGQNIRDSPHMQDNLDMYDGLKTHRIDNSLLPLGLIRESTISVRRTL